MHLISCTLCHCPAANSGEHQA